MIDINELRRLAQAANASPDGDVMSWIEGMQRLQGALLPDDVIELLDRLEAAEKSDAESLAMYRRARDERDALRAKITEMEQQEPVTWMQSTHLSSFKNRLCGSQSSYVHCSDHQLHPDFKPLYALPGGQKVPSVPDDGFKRAVMEIKDIGYGAIFRHLICERAAELKASPEAKP